MAPVTVREDHCFVLGATRKSSADSRDLGPIPYSVIEGHADYIYCPAADWSRFGRIE
jgi:type IV secretory pathway protease TraF